MKTDIQIAQEAVLTPILEVAQQMGIPQEAVIPYGRTKAKVVAQMVPEKKTPAKVILVTAISPTPAGEGKTTTSVGLADALHRMGKNVCLALREPSLGPVFGIKGGAAGGGYAQVVPMEDINLHFTGDLHAIGAANNLLAAMVDNHIHHGNALGIDPRRITWKRCVDMNDRQLRFLVDGLGGKVNGTPREDGFDITVASEVMAIFCLASSLSDLKQRLARIGVGYTYGGQPVTAGQLHAEGAMTALLKDAFEPNLVQTLEHTPAFVHGGPFANIAHGCNSVEYGTPNVDYLAAGSANLRRHVENMQKKFGLPVCVAINAFPTDSAEEHAYLRELCADMGVPCALSEVFAKGGEGGLELAENVLGILEQRSIRFAYPEDMDVDKKLLAVCRDIYGAKDVVYSTTAKKQLAEIKACGFGKLPVCIAKTQYSFSDDASLLGAPEGFTMTVNKVRLSAGAGFVVAEMGNIMTMPGLPKKPAAEAIDVDEHGVISGLF